MKSLLTSLFLSGSLLAQNYVPVEHFAVPDDLEVSIWATSPMFYNPTNMDTDAHGRIWVAEGVNYRRSAGRRAEGDRIVVLQDTNGDGKADSTHVFVQEKALIAPLGISVLDNKIVVAQPPSIIVYTDVNRDLRFDPKVDTREALLTGFNGSNHDHSLHATVSGPDGKWYINQGNCGAQFTDKSGKTFSIGGPYYNKGGGTPEWFNNNAEYGGKKSDDGHVWVGGFIGRMNPDGSEVQIVGHGFRNSYEHCLSSFGDIFQNDNDDPPACRNTWIMEGGFLGFFSADGRRTWQQDKRLGQDVPTAQWRQEDPGSLPAGDIYGPGSPTGIAFYENGALPAKYAGTLLSAEARQQVIFSYQPTLKRAAVDLGKRSNFFKVTEGDMFRPSDVMVGADGAIYVADWFDPGVGGHRDADETMSGTIYRIAPKGFSPKIADPEDRITQLRSPANSVRFAGFAALKAQGERALPAIREVLADRNPFIAARGVWLLPFLGDEGANLCRKRLAHKDPAQRILAFRALRNAGHDIKGASNYLALDRDPAVRRELAVSLRDVPGPEKRDLVQTLLLGVDAEDRTYLEAIGLAAEGIEDETWATLKAQQHGGRWSKAFTAITWRLKPEAALPDWLARAQDDKLSNAERLQAVDSIGFLNSKAAVNAMATLAKSENDIGKSATWWLLNRGLGPWAEFGARELLKTRGIYNPDTIVVNASPLPEWDGKSALPPIAEIAKLKGDAARGKITAARCYMCHKIGDQGIVYGPTLNSWVANQGIDAFLEAVIFPSKGIAHGYSGRSLLLKDKGVIDGLVFGNDDPVVIQSMGGVTQLVPRNRIKKQWKLKRSLMLSADQLGLTAQDLADLAAYLKTL